MPGARLIHCASHQQANIAMRCGQVDLRMTSDAIELYINICRYKAMEADVKAHVASADWLALHFARLHPARFS
jgi:hypothetical protein